MSRTQDLHPSPLPLHSLQAESLDSRKCHPSVEKILMFTEAGENYLVWRILLILCPLSYIFAAPSILKWYHMIFKYKSLLLTHRWQSKDQFTVRCKVQLCTKRYNTQLPSNYHPKCFEGTYLRRKVMVHASEEPSRNNESYSVSDVRSCL